MVDPNEVADVIDKTHDVLLVEGWCQELLRDSRGRLCLDGAISTALNIRTTDGNLVYPSCSQLYDNSKYELATAVVHALLEQAGAPEDSHRPAELQLAYWQDDPDRTVDDVLDLCRRTSKQQREIAA